MTAAWHLAGGAQQVQRNAGGARKPPPSPPSPPPPFNFPSLSPDPNTNQGSYLSRAFNSNVMVVLAVVLFALVVVAVLNTLARCRIMRRLRMQQQLGEPESQQQQQQHQRQHKGLEKAEIEALPVITYGGVGKLNIEDVGSNDCVVCLSEYQKGEKVRLLPLCNHGFHLDCIDTWLITHTSCPVCRHSVLESTDNQTAHPAPPEGSDHQQHHHQPSTSSQDGASSSTGDNVQGGAAASLGGTGTRIGSALFGTARFGSANRTNNQQHMEIEVGPELRDVAGGASTSNRSSTRWSFSEILSPGGLARLSSGAAEYTRRQQLQLQNQATPATA